MLIAANGVLDCADSLARPRITMFTRAGFVAGVIARESDVRPPPTRTVTHSDGTTLAKGPPKKGLTLLHLTPILAQTDDSVAAWLAADGEAQPVAEQKKINIELRDEEAEGVYANFAVITHSPAEFVVDFIRVLPGTKKSRVHARIVMAPQNVKAFSQALADNIQKYEAKHGEIQAAGREQSDKQIGFQ